MNTALQKFVGIYNNLIEHPKSGTSETDIMNDAYTIYFRNENESFKFEHAWRMLKDEPKWLGASIHTDSSVANPVRSLERPMGQKAAKKKAKEKVVEASSNNTNNEVQEIMGKKASALEKLAKLKEEELELKEMEMIMKDTSGMTKIQRRCHESFCKKLIEKHGL